MAGIAEFRRKVRPSYIERFAHLALGQSPDCLFFACSDSRVVPSVFASTEPGDLFVVRNVGNLVPPCDPSLPADAHPSEAAAVEFALTVLGVRDIVVCGHSDCGAMRALLADSASGATPNLHAWLGIGKGSLERRDDTVLDPALLPHNRLSQLNVLQQLDHLRSYEVVRERVASGALALHAWWFDLAHAEVSMYHEDERRFLPIRDEDVG